MIEMYYYKRIKDGKTTTVEAYSHNQKIKGAVKCTKKEYDDFIAALPEPEPEQTMILNSKEDAEVEK